MDFIHRRQLDLGTVDKTAERVLENIDAVWSNYIDAIEKGASTASQPTRKTTNLALIKTSSRSLTQFEEKSYGNLEKDMLRNPIDFSDPITLPRTPPAKFLKKGSTDTSIDAEKTTESASPLQETEFYGPSQKS